MQIPILIGIMNTMLANEQVSARQLAEKFELSPRSVYRYVDALCEAGVPIESRLGKNGGWKIIDKYKLNSACFDKAEYERLLFVVRSFSLQDSITRSISDKIAGLNRSVKNTCVLQSTQLVVDTPLLDELQEKIDKLSFAIFRNRFVDIEYHSKDSKITKRTVEPYSLVLKDGMWYVYCFCRLRNQFRFFKIVRIAKMIVLEQKFPSRKFSVDSEKINTDVLKGREFVEMQLFVDSKGLTAVEEWLGLGNVKKDGEDFKAQATLPFDEVLVDKLLSMGSLVKVLAPEKLKKAVTDRCKDILKQY